MKKTITKITLHRALWVITLTGMVLLGGCNGPANPEPVMIHTGSVFLSESQPGEVNLYGEMGAAENADGMIVQNLDGIDSANGPVDGAGAFDLLLLGLAVDRYRLIAFSDDGGFASLVVTSNGVDPEVIVVNEGELGCVTVEPPLLDLGAGPAQEPLYGELSVRNNCPDPLMFITQDTGSIYFTAVSLLVQEPLEPGGRAIVSVVFLAPAGSYNAHLVMEPDLPIPDPEQVTLQVALRADALP